MLLTYYHHLSFKIKTNEKSGMVVHTCSPSARRLMQVDCEFENRATDQDLISENKREKMKANEPMRGLNPNL
jgi:hypothetical protein